MRWFLDTEFIDTGRTIDLISLGMVSEMGEQYYRVLSEGWRRDDCCDWVKEHVLPVVAKSPLTDCATRLELRTDLKRLLLRDGTPEIWGYYADYDWVVFAQLFGRMVDLPKGMPKYCRDLKQLMDQHGIRREDLPAQKGIAHHALHDAIWNRDAWLAVQDRVRNPVLLISDHPVAQVP